MNRILTLSVAIFASIVPVATAAVTTETGSAKDDPIVVITKNCPSASKQPTYKGNVIVYVSGNGCVSIDNGATAIASGNTTVAAHGNSAVVASGNTTLIVFNESVSCKIKGPGVTVLSAIKDRLGRLHARCLAARTI
ncbi:MAG: hypothetical protein AAB834_01910 [Patescibacteria group bacterium]